MTPREAGAPNRYVAAVGDALLDDLDPDQRAAVTSPHLPLAILAPAGSGKTRVLTRRIAFRIREHTCEARHVLALTFTRKAAGELVDRLGRLGADGPVTAGTFHAVALRELRGRAIERGLEPPRVLDRKLRLLAGLLEDKARRRDRARRSRGRDRMGEGPARRPGSVRRGGAHRRTPAARRRPTRSPSSTSGTRPSDAGATCSTSTTCSASVRAR